MASRPAASPRPTLLVHGMWGSRDQLLPLSRGLETRGLAGVVAIDLRRNDGSAAILELATEVAVLASRLAEDSGGPIDIVGFSMGALVTRVAIQRLGGQSFLRRFVSISGPHHGTLAAWAGWPRPGIRDMRPGSPLLSDLARDPDPFGNVEVHCVYTPWDALVVPARTAILAGARSVRAFPVKMHRWMISDERVLDHVADLLRAPL